MTRVKSGFLKGAIIAVAAAVLPLAALAALGSQQDAATGPLARGATLTSEGGRVTVAVSWDGQAPKQGDQFTLAFQVAMDTHFVDLDAYDLAKLAILRNDRGETVQAASWEAPRGGHHRKGVLTFAVPITFTAGARFLELMVRDVAGVAARQFRWELGVSP